MLLNRIPLRVASAIGAAAVVASAAFAVSAFADSGADPSAAVTDVAGAGEETPFFVAGEDPSDEEVEEFEEHLGEAEAARDDAVDSSSASGSSSVTEDEEEEEEEPQESEDGGGSEGGGGGDVPSGSPREIAQNMLSDFGWGDDQWSCLDSLWQKESNWNHTAQNPSSGAYGIPQSLPGDKMASSGSDWRTNPATQIDWGLGYIDGRYGSPCAAWSHSQSNNWY